LKVVLFGSYANGKPNPDSDVDLLVVMPLDDNPVDKSVEMRLKLQPPFPLDLLVRTPAKIKERLAIGDDFIKDILMEGAGEYQAGRGSSRCMPEIARWRYGKVSQGRDF
jgi:uncharacterized protein